MSLSPEKIHSTIYRHLLCLSSQNWSRNKVNTTFYSSGGS
jgi:hypothetical protein